jgi:L-ribulose-5-phosphate 3-epimerase
MDRRTFIASAATAGWAAAQSNKARFTKSICSVIFPPSMPLAECFRRAKASGFEGIELRLEGEIGLEQPAANIRRVGDEARKAGIAIVSVWVSQPLEKCPLNSDDPALRSEGSRRVQQALETASMLGCGAILLVPGRLGNGPVFRFGYEDTWNRVSTELRKLAPHAEKTRVTITPENVWNKFLVSPLEMRAFIDQFHTPWIQSHFDTGNVMQFGYPEDWILTLGQRIKRVHLKDYKLSSRAEQGRFVPLLEGDVNWKSVMAALVKVGYSGYLSPEIDYEPNNPDNLTQVSRAVDKILALV